jgi:ArsR family transcriptional regulator, lead/cadmium/zinc/bismuth-responsive transcriptional repressor
MDEKPGVDEQEERGCWAEPHSHALGALPLLDQETCKRSAAIFRALGDVSRLQLLALLAKREMCVTELTEQLSDNLPAISQRLKLLRAERLVRTRRQGKHIYYSLADNHIALLIENGLAHGSQTECNFCPPLEEPGEA